MLVKFLTLQSWNDICTCHDLFIEMRNLLLILFFVQTYSTFASHIVGGDIYYDYLGGNNYRFYITIYRDCFSTGAAYDDPLHLAVYNINNSLVQDVEIPFPGSVILPVVFNNPCVTPPNNICVEKAIYTAIVTLPPAVGGYTVSYQRCCRGPNINNLVNPDDTGITLTCHVPGIDQQNTWNNSSPRFVNYPPLLLCNNEDLVFNHSATDPDGDQLVYSLVTPYSGGTSFNPQPIPAPSPPYAPVNWNSSFSAANPLGPGATINIDPNTGLLTANPEMTGIFVVGVKVDEIRNGVVINSTIRDFLFKVFNCELQLQAIVPEQSVFCSGLTYQFQNNSFGGSNYSWDFGVPGIGTDISTAYSPSYTYPSPGNYQAILVINPGWPCTDTAYVDVSVSNGVAVNFSATDSVCEFQNSIDFIANGTGTGLSYFWNFGNNASIQTANTQIVNDVHYSVSGLIPVTIQATDGVCSEEYTENIYIFPEPVAIMEIPESVECDGFTVPFGNSSENAINYHWDFGVTSITSDTSNFEETDFTYSSPGIYTVTLIAGSTSICQDTVSETIEINEPLIIDFTSQDSMCIAGNSFDFDGTVSGPPGSVFTWNFGTNASIQSSAEIDVTGVSFFVPGDIPITLTGTFEECIENMTHSIYLYREPTIDFSIEPGLQCVPFQAQFYDYSTAETGIIYYWEFGDGFSSNEQNPSHLYTETGNYPVQLTIRTTSGCVDTLSMIKPDLVNVRPNPVAGFKIDPEKTDICHSSIDFIDNSSGANQFYYYFDDLEGNSNEANPVYQYKTDGTHFPYQIVTNEYGCKDTAYSHLLIEPFTLFAPNAFSPDSDEFNNVFQPILYLEVVEWKLEIFDRWGERVFYSEKEKDFWDGTNPKGMICQDGIYVYKITFVSCEPGNPERLITGHVSLLR